MTSAISGPRSQPRHGLPQRHEQPLALAARRLLTGPRSGTPGVAVVGRFGQHGEGLGHETPGPSSSTSGVAPSRKEAPTISRQVGPGGDVGARHLPEGGGQRSGTPIAGDLAGHRLERGSRAATPRRSAGRGLPRRNLVGAELNCDRSNPSASPSIEPARTTGCEDPIRASRLSSAIGSHPRRAQVVAQGTSPWRGRFGQRLRLRAGQKRVMRETGVVAAERGHDLDLASPCW